MVRKDRDDVRNVANPADRDTNPDAITGEPGSHPVGAGLGAAAGGAAAGMAVGAATGPIGAAAGAIIGGIAGGYAGKAVAEQIDPTVEANYWRDEYRNREYYDPTVDYDQSIAPAYKYGWEARSQYGDRTWDEVETDLSTNWRKHRGTSQIEWDRARPAAQDAWNRVDTHRGAQ